MRLLAYLALAIALIFLDSRGAWLQRVRAQAELAVQPLWWLAGLPGRVGNTLRDDAATNTQLIKENRALRNELLLANARLTRFATAAADNQQLRALLGAAQRDELKVQLAPILNIDLDPTRQRLVLDAGSRDGVRVGQTVLDAGGLMGQIIDVRPMHSTVLLLTDPDHAVPVMVARNGVRLVAYGRGRSDRLELVNIPRNSDVKVGDEIVSSGLGGRFPAGFPVGKLRALHPDESHAFWIGDVTPAAQLDRGRDVLLLMSGQPKLQVPATVPAPAAVAAAQPASAQATTAGAAKPAATAPAATTSPSQSAATPPAATKPQAVPAQEPRR
nr:rod shape-determining protein MreC [Pseudoxanthomonas helianthi]